MARRLTNISALMIAALVGSSAQAQVVITSGVQTIYDDNIYLEDDLGGDQAGSLTPDLDGKPDDDIITSVFTGFSTDYIATKYVGANYSLRVGGLIFADRTDESRLTLDQNISLEASEYFLPKPYYLRVGSNLTSGNAGISAAQSTGARQSQIHTASLGLGVTALPLASATTLDLGYSLVRQDFLGEFLFGSSADSDRSDVNGSDSFVNGLRAVLNHQFSSQWTGSFGNNLFYTTFTDVDSSFVDNSGNLDRLQYTPYLGATYAATERLSFFAQVGMDLVSFSDEPPGQTYTVIGPDGGLTTETTEPDQTTVSPMFNLGLSYLFSPQTVLQLSVAQAATADIDGTRVFTRTISSNLTHFFTQKLSGTLGGGFTQFSRENGYSSLTNRFEWSAALRYPLSDSLSVAGGYNYAQQDGDGFYSRGGSADGDYEVNRAFFAIEGGLLGLPS